MADNNWRVGWKSRGRSVRSYRRIASEAIKIKTSVIIRIARDEKKVVWDISRSILSDSAFYLSPETTRWRRRRNRSRTLPNPITLSIAETKIFIRAKAVGGWMNKA